MLQNPFRALLALAENRLPKASGFSPGRQASKEEAQFFIFGSVVLG